MLYDISEKIRYEILGTKIKANIAQRRNFFINYASLFFDAEVLAVKSKIIKNKIAEPEMTKPVPAIASS